MNALVWPMRTTTHYMIVSTQSGPEAFESSAQWFILDKDLFPPEREPALSL